jgi:hypothetical protein
LLVGSGDPLLADSLEFLGDFRHGDLPADVQVLVVLARPLELIEQRRGG